MRSFIVQFPIEQNLIFKFSCNPVKGKKLKYGKEIRYNIEIKNPNNIPKSMHTTPFAQLHKYLKNIKFNVSYNFKNGISGIIVFNPLVRFIICELRKSDKRLIYRAKYYKGIYLTNTATTNRSSLIYILWALTNPTIIEAKNPFIHGGRSTLIPLNEVKIDNSWIYKNSTKLYNTTVVCNNIKITILCYIWKYAILYSFTSNIPCMNRSEEEIKSVKQFYLHPLFQRCNFYDDFFGAEKYYHRSNIVMDCDVTRYILLLLILDDKGLSEYMKINIKSDVLQILNTRFLKDISNLITLYLFEVEDISYYRNILHTFLELLWV